MWIDQIDRVQLFCAVVTLIPTRTIKPTVGAGALNIAIGQITTICVGIHLCFADFRDQVLIGQDTREMLCQALVLCA